MERFPPSHAEDTRQVEQLLNTVATQFRSAGLPGDAVVDLTQAFGRLESSERQLRAAIDHFPFAVVVYGEDRRFQYVNAEAVRLSGRYERDLIGRRDEEVLPPEITRAYLPALGRAFEQRTPQSVECTVRPPRGVLTLAATFVPLPDDAGNLRHVLGVAQDVTDRRLLEQRMRTEHTVIGILEEAPTLKDAVPRMLEALCRTAGWELGAFWMVDRQQDVLRCVDVWHQPSLRAAEFERLTRCITFTRHVGLPGRVWASGRAVALRTVIKDTNFPRRWAAVPAGLRGAIGFPVVLENEVMGVVELFSREMRRPDERLLGMMSVIGGQIGHLIHRKQAEEALAQSEARNAAVLTAALDAIISMDHTGRVTEWNPAAERIFGYTHGEAVGQMLAELIIPPALRERHRMGLIKYLATGQGPLIGHRVEITAVRKGGEEFPVELAITPTAAGAAPRFTGHLRDISERRQAEAQARAKEKAETASRAKDQFLAVLSHELRTPLTPVLTTVQIMERDATLSPDQQESVHLIHRNVELETKLIDDLLDLTQISRGKIDLHMGLVDLHSLLGHVVAICESDIRSKRLNLEMDLNAPRHYVEADPARLHQVFWNLLKNAIKFTPADGRISLSTEQTGGSCIVVSVRDTGEGIEPDALPLIFNAFEQGGAAVTRKFGGLGLGLAISKRLVEQHGGKLTAASAGKGKGATFAVTLCLAREVEKAPPSSKPTQQRPLSGKTGRILLVEDSPDTVRTMSKLLKRFGYEVHVATSVAEALRAARAETFDLLLCDIGLPDGSGLDVMRQLSKERPIKGIALSGYGMDQDIDKSKRAGFVEHLTKPVDLNQLEVSLDRVMAGA